MDFFFIANFYGKRLKPEVVKRYPIFRIQLIHNFNFSGRDDTFYYVIAESKPYKDKGWYVKRKSMRIGSYKQI